MVAPSNGRTQKKQTHTHTIRTRSLAQLDGESINVCARAHGCQSPTPAQRGSLALSNTHKHTIASSTYATLRHLPNGTRTLDTPKLIRGLCDYVFAFMCMVVCAFDNSDLQSSSLQYIFGALSRRKALHRHQTKNGRSDDVDDDRFNVLTKKIGWVIRWERARAHINYTPDDSGHLHSARPRIHTSQSDACQ